MGCRPADARRITHDPRIVFLGIILSTVITGESFGASAGTTRTVAGGGVTVKATYLAETEHESRFSLAMDTHSANLDGYDLKTLSILRDDTRIVLQPTSVDNKGGGHHREVILTFPRPSLKRKWLELVIKDIAGEKERIFRW